MDPVKVVIAGPFGAGKTTLIRTISEITVLSTESDISDGSGIGEKNQTTVGIDFGRITIAEDLILYLFGTPGQKRFDFMWEVASKGMLGFILVVDHARPESLTEAQEIFDYFATHQTPSIVAVNKGSGTMAEREAVAAALGIDDTGRVVTTDARDRESVKETLISFLEHLLCEHEDRVAV